MCFVVDEGAQVGWGWLPREVRLRWQQEKIVLAIDDVLRLNVFFSFLLARWNSVHTKVRHTIE